MQSENVELKGSAGQHSFPKDRIKILLLESVHPAGIEVLLESGYSNIETLAGALAPAELMKAAADAHVIGIRSKTHVPAEVFAATDRLLAIGAFCIGTDQVDLGAATRGGIPVFNSPFSSTRSVAELVIGAAILLLRRIPDKSAAAHRGEWLKSAAGAHELRGKTIGIIGYGRIGSQVSILAEALNLRVLYWDITPRLALGGARLAGSLQDLLGQSDIVTLHVPDDTTTRGLMTAEKLALIKPGAVLINYARGKVVDGEALAAALRTGHLAGAALDVFPEEPATTAEAFVHPVQGLPNVLLSPHIGGSTEEAQETIGRDVAQKVVSYLDAGVTVGSVTVPELNLPPQAGAHRLLHIHTNTPGILAEINLRLSALGCNIVAQYLKTNEQIGYVVLDIEQGKTQEALQALRGVPHTIKTRSLY